MIISKLISGIKPINIIGDVNKEIVGVNIDSRKIEANHLFIAVKGTSLLKIENIKIIRLIS